MDPLWHVDGNVKLDRSLHVDGNMKSDGCLHTTTENVPYIFYSATNKSVDKTRGHINPSSQSGCVYTLVIVVKSMVSPWTGKLKASLLKATAQ